MGSARAAVDGNDANVERQSNSANALAPAQKPRPAPIRAAFGKQAGKVPNCSRCGALHRAARAMANLCEQVLAALPAQHLLCRAERRRARRRKAVRGVAATWLQRARWQLRLLTAG